jgi:hypothetical protein
MVGFAEFHHNGVRFALCARSILHAASAPPCLPIPTATSMSCLPICPDWPARRSAMPRPDTRPLKT